MKLLLFSSSSYSSSDIYDYDSGQQSQHEEGDARRRIKWGVRVFWSTFRRLFAVIISLLVGGAPEHCKTTSRGVTNALLLRNYERACRSVDGERHCEEAEGRSEADGHQDDNAICA